MALSKIDVANMVENEMPQANIDNNINFRNIIINGGMDLAQRGTSFSSMSNGQFITDRFFYDRAGLGVTAAFTGSQSTDVPSGTAFSNSLKMDVTTAQTLGASGGTYLGVTTKVEGYNYKLVSNQKAVISFWVKSNLTGTYSIVFRNNGNDRVLVEEYTINSASTWEKKTIALPTFTTDGTWNYTNGMGVSIFYCLAVAGDNDTSTIGSWISSGVSSIYGSSNNVEFASSTSNEWYITGVQLEAGQTASEFEFLPFDVNLTRCQRYFEKSYNVNVNPGTSTSNGLSAGHFHGTAGQNTRFTIFFQTRKRANPTIVGYDQVGNINKESIYNQANTRTDNFSTGSRSFPNIGTNSFNFNEANLGTTIRAYATHWTASSEL